MSELKVYHCNEWHNEYTEFYMKFEADKAIADLEESHKKEVEQLLIEIMKLKNEIKEQKRLRDMALASVPNVLKVIKIIQHQKYKRCLAMAMWCKRKRIDAADYRIPRKKWEFYDKWYKRWLELAEQFKEVK